jgi:hypothetical protein
LRRRISPRTIASMKAVQLVGLSVLVVLAAACFPDGPTRPTARADVSPLDQAPMETEPPPEQPARIRVPDVTGRGVEGARKALQRRGFRVEVVERSGGLLTLLAHPGEVIDQRPPSITRRVEGSTVTLVVADPPACDPNYTGACLNPAASDYDCGGGTGTGPRYVWSTVRVVGFDRHGLDDDGDGYGCDSL